MPVAPTLLHPFPEWSGRVQAAFTTRQGGISEGAYGALNLGFHCGDDPQRVQANWESALESAGLAGKTLVLPKMIHGDRAVDAETMQLSEAIQSSFTQDKPKSLR